MTAPVLLDLYCCQGGASAGYAAAGFRVVGVDIDPQPRYPYTFHQGDAITLLPELAARYGAVAVAASPPCQAHTLAQRIQGNTHPDLIGPTRDALDALGLPYVIENVPGAPIRADLNLCGAMFGLRTYRHRLFELGGWTTEQPDHPEHVAPLRKMGRPPRDGEYMHVVGNFSGVDTARDVMGMPWASRDGLREAIPPAYSQWIGERLHRALRGDAA